MMSKEDPIPDGAWWIKPPDPGEALKPASGRAPLGRLVRRVPPSYKGRTMGGIRAVGRVRGI